MSLILSPNPALNDPIITNSSKNIQIAHSQDDPLNSSNSVIFRTYNFGENAWKPLSFSGYFGPQPYPDNATAFNDSILPQGEYIPLNYPLPTGQYASWGYFHPKILDTSWLYDYPEITNTYQFEYVRQNLGNLWDYPYDEEIDYNFVGFISSDITYPEISGKPIRFLPQDKILWRMYASNNDKFWGLSYGQNYSRNWYFTEKGNSGIVLFRQNVTIPIDQITRSDLVGDSVLKIKYCYPTGFEGDNGRFGIGYWNYSAFNNNPGYVYIGEGSTDEYELWNGTGLMGYKCENKPFPNNSSEWQTRTVNVTEIVKTAIQNYESNGSIDSRYLQLEIAFSGLNDSSIISIDDIELEVNYWSEYIEYLPDAPIVDQINYSHDDFDHVMINWSVVPNASKYYIYQDNQYISNITDLLPIGNTVNNTYFCPIFSNNTYYYVVVAENTTGTSEISNCVSIIVEIPPNPSYLPNAPILYSITPNPSNNGNISLEWDDIDDTIIYYIYRDLNPISTLDGLSPIANSIFSNYSDVISINGTYYYTVVASNASGNSTLSNCINITVIISQLNSSPISPLENNSSTSSNSDFNNINQSLFEWIQENKFYYVIAGVLGIIITSGIVNYRKKYIIRF